MTYITTIRDMQVLRFGLLDRFGERLLHFSTTRLDAAGNPFCMGFETAENESPRAASRLRLAKAMEIESERFAFCRQMHTRNAAIVTDKTSDKGFYYKKHAVADTDALITATPGICVVAQSADCVPILLYDPENNVIAAIHSGWKGTAKRILQKTIEKMVRQYATIPGNLICCIGPSAGPCCYEVGEDVYTEFAANFDDPDPLFVPLQNGKHLLNLWSANATIARFCGIPDDNIETAAICTICNSNNFHSARVHKNETGRMSTGIMIR